MFKIKYAVLALLGLVSPLASAAQEVYADAISCFSNAPESVFPLFDKSTRLDMLDYYDAKVEKGSPNAYSGKSRIANLTYTPIGTDSIVQSIDIIATEGGSRMQVFVVDPDQKEPVMGVILTVPTPINDSEIALYDRNWQRLGSKTFSMPTLADWVKPEGKKRMAEIEAAIPFIMASASFDPLTQAIIITNNMAQYYVPSDTPEALSLLRDELVYVWNGRQFKLVK